MASCGEHRSAYPRIRGERQSIRWPCTSCPEFTSSAQPRRRGQFALRRFGRAPGAVFHLGRRGIRSLFGPEINWLLARLESVLGKWTDAERDFDEASRLHGDRRASRAGPSASRFRRSRSGGVTARGERAGRRFSIARISSPRSSCSPSLAKRVESGAQPSSTRAHAARRSAGQRRHPMSQVQSTRQLPISRSRAKGKKPGSSTRGDRNFRVKDTRGIGECSPSRSPSPGAPNTCFSGRDRSRRPRRRGTPCSMRQPSARVPRAAGRFARARARSRRGLRHGTRRRGFARRSRRSPNSSPGLGSRRKASSRGVRLIERARSNVQRRIKDAIRRIEEQDAGARYDTSRGRFERAPSAFSTPKSIPKRQSNFNR